PIPRAPLIAGFLVVFMPFMYLYGFYKSGGMDGLVSALRGNDSREWMEKSSGRTWTSMILEDLGRADIQALVLQRLIDGASSYDYAWGKTYLGTLSFLIPRQILQERPGGKLEEGTELIFGRHSYSLGLWASSKVYGLAGETMLNFGPA